MYGIVIILMLSIWSGAQAAQTRLALVVGNDAYPGMPLSNPVNDARLIAATLDRLGFRVIIRTDADQITMKRAIEAFGERLDHAGAGAVGLFYYAGHGLQLSGRNYLIPIDARIHRAGDVEIEAVSADWVLAQMRYARNGLNIVILDACRNNPFARGLRSINAGLAKMDAPAGTLIAYSTAPGTVAEDGSGADSPYTQALAQAMGGEGGMPVEEVFKHTRVAVMAATAGRQVPWESSSLTGDFFFSGSSAAPAGPLPPLPGPAAQDHSTEVAFWQGLQGSRNPGDFSAYLRRYPHGLFADLARRRLAGLQRQPEPQAGAGCSDVVGHWQVSVNQISIPGEVKVRDDRTLEWWKDTGDRLPSVTGSWACDAARPRRFVLTWAHGGIDTLELSADRSTLSGTNQFGMRILDRRLP
jgi:uncharacterized caspase-like protein